MIPAEAVEAAAKGLPTAKCDLCGRFTRNATLIWTSGPEPEPDYVAGDCCLKRHL